MNIFQEIYGHHITFVSKRTKGSGTNERSRDLAWVYVGQEPARLKACRSLKNGENERSWF